MSNEKITSYDWKYHQDWQRHILRSSPKIPRECRRPVLIAFCFALTADTAAGQVCFKSNQRIAEELGIERKYLKKYRWLATELGWFVPTGTKRNRVEPLRINIPSYQADVPSLPESLCDKPSAKRSASVGAKPSVTEPDPWDEYG